MSTGDERTPSPGGPDLHADLGPAVKLRGDPEDRKLMRAAIDGDYVVVRRMLLAPPYRADEAIADRIVSDLRDRWARP